MASGLADVCNEAKSSGCIVTEALLITLPRLSGAVVLGACAPATDEAYRASQSLQRHHVLNVGRYLRRSRGGRERDAFAKQSSDGKQMEVWSREIAPERRKEIWSG